MIDMNSLMKQFQEMQSKVSEMDKEIESKTYGGTSGGGLVKITINGKKTPQSLKIDPELINKDEVEILEDLIIAAFNDAIAKSNNDNSNGMSDMLKNIQMPPGMKFPF